MNSMVHAMPCRPEDFVTTPVATISIITPNFNHARYLERCIRSVAM
jgi:hypothetical protein